MKFDFNDIVIEPKYLSSISSRKEIDYYYGNGFKLLPIFVSPVQSFSISRLPATNFFDSSPFGIISKVNRIMV